MNTLDHVKDFLSAIDTPFTVSQAARTVIDRAMEDANIGSAIVELVRQVQDNPVITKEHIAFYERLRDDSRLTFTIPDTPGFVRPLLAVGHMRATTELESPEARRKIRRLREQDVKKVADTLAKIEPDFFGELLVETTIRATKDPAFALSLQNEAAKINESLPQLDEPTLAMLRNNGGGDEGCVGCVSDPLGNTKCEGIPCWVIIVVIVIIIVTK